MELLESLPMPGSAVPEREMEAFAAPAAKAYIQ